MKKSIVAVGVIAVLAVGYVGISWHTGNMIESNIDRKINQFSQKVNQNLSGYNLAISYSDYQKNIFSTKMHVTIKLSPKEMSGEQENEESSTLFDDDITIRTKTPHRYRECLPVNLFHFMQIKILLMLS